MKKVKNILNERTGGLFLLMLAILILIGMTWHSQKARSQNNNYTNGNQPSNNEQVAGVTANSSDNSNQVADQTGETVPPPANQNLSTKDNQQLSNDNSSSDDDTSYNDLKNNLKEYCGKKNFDVKKCREYLLEARADGKKDRRYKDLYNKYHYETPDDVTKQDNKTATDSNSTSSGSETTTQNQKWTLVVDSGSGTTKYTIFAPAGSVLDLMSALAADKSQNFSYHAQSSGFIDEINGLKNSGDMSWMLYTCKGDTCKLSSVGAADCQVKDWDKIEWEYVDWTKITWDTW